MAKNTLKNRHNTRLINERLQKADKRLLKEVRMTSLLLESMDERDLKIASEIIEKLRKIKGKGLKTLDSALEQAESQLNKYTAGGPLTKAWTKLKGIAGIDNPLVKFLTFANALEMGFRQMPTILKNNIDTDLQANADKPLTQLVTDPSKQKVLADNMMKALSPKGLFGAFKKVPYIDKQTLVQDLMNVPIKTFVAIIQHINSGSNTQQVADDIKDVATQQGDVASRTSTGTEPAQPTSGTSGTKAAKNTTKTSPTAATGETPNREPKTDQLVASVYQKFSPAFEDILGNNSEKRAKSILKFLADNGLLRDE